MAQGKRGAAPISEVLDRMVSRSIEVPCLIKGLVPVCWVFTGAKLKGYGQVHVNGRTGYTHQVSYAELIGPMPEGLEPDHLCGTAACWNPWHLDPVTHAENVRRSRWTRHQRLKTHCPKGHPYSPENTYRPPGPRPHRECLTCRRARNRANYLERKRTGTV